ncbi:hypothetical protein C8R46DRAFT_678274 [Mycena filopes]|nr:hypothetical protein C8R46DRAFT_678274 [Mycena filopes]
MSLRESLFGGCLPQPSSHSSRQFLLSPTTSRTSDTMPKAKPTKDTSGDADNNSGDTKKTRTRDIWPATGLAILVRVFLEEKKLARQAESGWTAESYHRVVVALAAEGIVRTTKQVKSCWTRMKGQYKIVKGMLTLSGFGFNAATKTVTATEQVWDAYLQKHKKHAAFKNRPFIHYDDLAFLCDDVMATGEDAFSNGAAGGTQSQNPDDHDGSFDSNGAGGAGDDGDDEEDEDEDDEEPTAPRGALKDISNNAASFPSTPKVQSHRSIGSASSKKATVGANRSRHGRMSSTSVLAGLAASVETLAASFQEESQAKTSDSPARRETAWDAMVADEGLDLSDNEFAAAVEVFSSTKLADQYLKFPVERKAARRLWLNTAIGRVMGTS